MDTITIIRLVLIALQFAVVIWAFIALYRSERKRISYEKDLEKNNPYMYAVVQWTGSRFNTLAFYEDVCNALKAVRYFEKNRHCGDRTTYYAIDPVKKEDYREFVKSDYKRFEDFLNNRKEGDKNEQGE